jgi:hypothetical protein
MGVGVVGLEVRLVEIAVLEVRSWCRRVAIAECGEDLAGNVEGPFGPV